MVLRRTLHFASLHPFFESWCPPLDNNNNNNRLLFVFTPNRQTDRQTDRSVEARYCCTFVCFVIDLTCHSKVAVSEHEGGTDQREGNKRHLKVFLPQDGRKLALFGCSTASLVLVVVVVLLAVVLAVAIATASGVSFGAAVLTVRHIGCGRSNGSVVRRNGGTFGTEMFGSEQTLEHGFCGFGRFRWRR